MCANLTTNYEKYKGFMYINAADYFFTKKSEDGKTISWYYNATYGAAEQFNKNDQYYNYTYHVLAIGYKEEA